MEYGEASVELAGVEQMAMSSVSRLGLMMQVSSLTLEAVLILHHFEMCVFYSGLLYEWLISC